jgi:hypothetical protein
MIINWRCLFPTKLCFFGYQKVLSYLRGHPDSVKFYSLLVLFTQKVFLTMSLHRDFINFVNKTYVSTCYIYIIFI